MEKNTADPESVAATRRTIYELFEEIFGIPVSHLTPDNLGEPLVRTALQAKETK